MRTLLLPLLTLACLYAAPAQAGVIVLKNGKVLVGQFDDGDVDKDEIRLHPDGDPRNVLQVPRHTIRWFSKKGKEPSDDYWERFSDAKIDADYEPQRQRWLQRKKDKLDEIPAAEVDRELLETRTVQLRSKDGLPMDGDLYGASDKKRPFILLCHQAGSSRGEYRAIAPRLVKAGFACLAIDQRSGEAMNHVANMTAEAAKKEKKPTGYGDARQDIEAAIEWIRAQGFTGKLTLWGSSYSASLVLMIGAANKDVSAVLAFSPGDYLKPRGTVAKAAAGLSCPLLIVAPERERAQATALGDAVASKHKTLYINPVLIHGSRTLYKLKPHQTKPVWKVVFEFLNANCR
jgi:dienelactone hydrolase